MMNVNDGRMEPETELGLALASSSRCMPNTRSNSSGAGVNAASMVDMTVVASDHLSELVWSPHYGLSLKCAEKKASIFGDAGPSKTVLNPTGSFATPGAAANLHRENQLQASLDRSRATVGPIRPVIGSSHGYEEGASNDVEETKVVRGARGVDSDRKEEDTPMTDRKESSSKSVQFTCIAETAENYSVLQSPKTVEFFPIKANDSGPSKAQAELLSLKVTERDEEIMDSSCAVAGREQALGLEVGFGSGLHKMKQFKDSDSSASNSTSPDVRGRRFGEVRESKLNMVASASLYRRKGKEKALPDEETEDKISKGENSHESVESCNSGGAFSSGRKRPNYEQQLIVSKRLKTQTTETPVSSSLIGRDSSFMNWISNMVKGLNKMGDDEPPVPLALPGPVHRRHDQLVSRNDDPESRKMGFQTIFQSIYNCDSTHREVKTSKASAANVSPLACYGKNAVGTCSPPSSDQNKTVRTLACIDAKDGISPSNSLMCQPELDSVKNDGSETPLEAKAANDAELRSDHRGSLWITRLSAKATPQVLKSDASTDCTRTLTKIDRSSEVNEFLSNPALHVEKLNNPEAMTSVFAKRVDALKHIVSSDTMEAAAHTTTCFYCGRTGHNMGDCSEIAETERESLVKNVGQSDGVEDSSPTLCIRCFQPDHWAISCPTRSKFGPQRSKQGATLGRSEHVASSFGHSLLNEKQLDAPGYDRSRSKFDIPRVLFDAVRKLQLSRTDILKWMNSCTSLLHLNGYFLRLRLAKWDGGTGYHVACIAVDQREKSAQGSRKPISVDIGGTRCLVESQYISNQVFLEDELKAWWKGTMTSGGKIPSPDNLISKLEEKQKLGF